ncbi:MAG: diphosphate--fructose-6-phosphate 1-phosphotransferase, partial [Planctomycetes bacterium]|nr:diphosphate--fructose-6-phosphate 1-phosphotransferase [Planctomycetota bacterium]
MPLLKGNAVVGQAGGPTAVINQSLLGVIDECLKHHHIDRLLGARDGLLGIVQDRFVDLKRQPDALLKLIADTPGAALGSTRDKLNQAYAERMLASFRRHDIRYFFYIGGNDSAATVRSVQQVAADAHYDLRAMHIPKTIDNDLLLNDHCPGFGSAARFVAMAFIGDNLDNRALSGIKINVLMGRDAGFITAASVLARRHEDDGPHLIYLPERTFDVQRFIHDVADVVDRYDRAVIAVSEGIRDDKGEYWTSRISQDIEQDSFGHVQLSGSGSLADFLAGTLRSNLPNGPWRIRADTFGYLQRSFPATISAVDAWEARLVGQMAVIYSLEDIDAGSVVLTRLPGVSYACGTRLARLIEIAPDSPPFTKSLPAMYISSAGNDLNDSY